MDDPATAAAAVAAAVQLATALDAGLKALFLESGDLMRAAALPFLRETGGVSGTVTPMSGEAMLRTLRRHEAAARAAVAAAAKASGLAWQFEVVRERRVGVLQAAREARDFIVFPEAGAGPGGGLTITPVPASADDARPVAVALRDPQRAGQVLSAAAALAVACRAPLLFLLCGQRAEQQSRLRAIAAEAAADASVHASYVALPRGSAQVIAEAVRRHHARLLLDCDGEPGEGGQRLDALLARIRCPLVIAG